MLIQVNLQPRQDIPAPPRSPLPKCRGRNEDPIGKHAKATKVAAKKADKAAKVAEKEKKEVETKVAKDKLAELEVDESFIEQQEHQGRIRRQSDMGVGRSNSLNDSDDSDSSDEFGGLVEMVFCYRLLEWG